jgi:TRAP transporter 4TM/12TM fusion protein
MPILAVFFIVYAFYGRSFPGMLAHRGFDLERISAVLYLTTEGISGLPLQVSATYVAAFVIFAAFLDVSGAGRFFIDWSNALVGWVRGGPAKVAVIASALMGTISGSAVANVVSTGPFTIPLMKHVGLRPAFAGGVEAAASSGGQIMPPVMGAAAFIMVEILGVPYTEIVTAAILPAILYFIGILVMIDLEVSRLGIKGLDRSELGAASQIFLAKGHLALPLVALLFLLFYVDYTPTTSAFFATCAVIVSCYLRRSTWLPLREILEGLRRGGMGLLEVAAVCACAGIVIGVMMLTGLGLRLSAIMIDVSGGSLGVLLVLTAVVALILGMGLPSSAVYVVLATLIAPAMVKLGVDPIAAHLFVFYFGVLGNVTPPVAIAAYAAAALAGANATATGIAAFRLALAGFLLPFIWIYSPSLILKGELLEVVGTTVSAIIGIVALSGALQGYLWQLPLSTIARILLLGASIALIVPGWQTDAVGLTLIAVTVFLSRYSRDRSNRFIAASGSRE